MKARLHIQNDTHMAEFPDNQVGMMQAKAFRRSRLEFRKRRIRKVCQAYPSQVPLGEVLRLT